MAKIRMRRDCVEHRDSGLGIRRVEGRSYTLGNNRRQVLPDVAADWLRRGVAESVENGDGRAEAKPAAVKKGRGRRAAAGPGAKATGASR